MLGVSLAALSAATFAFNNASARRGVLTGSVAQTLAITRQTSDMEERLKEKENALTQKFAALEASLAQLSVQSNALTAQIARLSPQG